MNPVANGECGAWSANNWGSFNQTTTVNPAVLEGWGTRNRDWQYSVGVQQELAPQIALEVSYNRRVWSNFFLTQNRALTAADFDEVTITAPSDPRLPNGGGYPVTFLTRNTRSTLGATDSDYTTTEDYGDETHYWHGIDVSFNARTRWGLTVQGGTSTGRGVNDTCETLTARFGRTMTPTIGAVGATGIVDGQAELQCDGALADQPSRSRLLHRAESRCPGQCHLPFVCECAARGRRGHEWFVAVRHLSHDGRAVPDRNRTTAGAGAGHSGCGPFAARYGYGKRFNVVDMRFAKVLRIGKTERTWAWTCTTCSTSTRRRRTRRCTTQRPTGRDGCNPRPSCCRGSRGSTCRWISDCRESEKHANVRPDGRQQLAADTALRRSRRGAAPYLTAHRLGLRSRHTSRSLRVTAPIGEGGMGEK